MEKTRGMISGGMRRAAAAVWMAMLSFGFSAVSYSQTIDIPDRKVRTSDAMRMIEEQSGYSFAYNEGSIDMDRIVTVKPSRLSLRRILGILFDDGSLSWEIIGSQIVVFPGTEDHADEIYAESADSELLEEAIVIGYGSIKRKDVSTSVSKIPVDDNDLRPVMSAAALIQGKAAGVHVIQPSGMPGTPFSVRVRGTTSVDAGNEPLYVVDGIPTDDISNLSPDDIASIQVLKDASSSAIYGARAANGVVIISTSAGISGKATLKFKTYAGVSWLGKTIDALDTEQYKDLMKELAEYTVTVPDIPDSETRYTDWSKELFGTGLNQNYSLSLSNGTGKLHYYASLTHSSEKGIINKAYFRRTGFRANLDSEIFSWITACLNFSYTHNSESRVYDSRSSMRSGSILSAINTPPFMQVWDSENPEQYDEDAYGARILNPKAANAADMLYFTDRLTGAFSLDFRFLRDIKLKSTFSIDLSNDRNDYFLDPVSTSDGRSLNGIVSEGNMRNFEWMFENVLSYDKSINGGGV